MELGKEDIPTLDFLLDLMVMRDSMVSGNDLKDFGKYKDSENRVVRAEFKRLMFFLDFLDVETPKMMIYQNGLTQIWLPRNSRLQADLKKRTKI